MKSSIDMIIPSILIAIGIIPANGFFIHPFLGKATGKNNLNRVISKLGKDGSDVDSLMQQAEKLRNEVNSFESEREEEKQKIRLVKEDAEREKQNEFMRYSAEVPILKGDGSEVMERVQFPPRFKGKKSKIIAVQAPLPLGLILGESEEFVGVTTVDEIGEGSNGELAGVKVGDILRACTACQVSMEMPTWQLMAGGIGRPKTSRMMFSTDGRPFEEVMDALISNQMDPSGRPSWLVLERNE
jgi:hypothetical protein